MFEYRHEMAQERIHLFSGAGQSTGQNWALSVRKKFNSNNYGHIPGICEPNTYGMEGWVQVKDNNSF